MTAHWLLISSSWLHPGTLARREMQALLDSTPGFSVARARSLEILAPRQKTILAPLREQYAGILLHGEFKTASFEALDRLFAFVDEGGGFVALHNASASFRATPAFAEMVGGRFLQEIGLRAFDLLPESQDDPLFGALDTISVTDQPCLHACDPHNRVHYRAQLGERLEPYLWTREFGAGRVLYCGAGYRAGTLRLPGMRRALQAGLEWAARQPLAEDEPVLDASAPGE